ncbi:MAG: DUF3108 domain-containing protein [Cyclobacteriaceae bacterium]
MKALAAISILIISMATAPLERPVYRHIDNSHFKSGEHLEYYAHYGFIKAAEGEMIINKNISTVNGLPCYKVDIYGKTTKFFDVIAKVRNHWGSYIDTASIIPQKFYRYIDEGSYKRNEIMEYDHKSDSLYVHVLIAKPRHFKKSNPTQCQTTSRTL